MHSYVKWSSDMMRMKVKLLVFGANLWTSLWHPQPSRTPTIHVRKLTQYMRKEFSPHNRQVLLKIIMSNNIYATKQLWTSLQYDQMLICYNAHFSIQAQWSKKPLAFKFQPQQRYEFQHFFYRTETHFKDTYSICTW